MLDPDFGPRSVDESDFAWETRFCGYRWDAETQLYQVRYRYYQPGLGRWLTRDPICEVTFRLLHASTRQNPAGVSDFSAVDARTLFIYLYNGPLNDVDRLGLQRSYSIPYEREAQIAVKIGLGNAARVKNAEPIGRACGAALPGGWGGLGDAVRHCTWLCEMAREIGYALAMSAGHKYEEVNPTPRNVPVPPPYNSYEEWAEADSAMDERNKQIGALLGTQLASSPAGCCCQLCTVMGLTGQLTINAFGGYR